jgi:hypothetical protein
LREIFLRCGAAVSAESSAQATLDSEKRQAFMHLGITH